MVLFVLHLCRTEQSFKLKESCACGPRRAEGQNILYLFLHQVVEEYMGYCNAHARISLFFVIAARNYLNLDIHVHHKTHKH